MAHQTPNQKEVIPVGYIPYCPPEEETLDLKEIWHALVKRKTTVTVITASFLVAALLYLAVAKPVYEAHVLLQTGTVRGKAVTPAHTLRVYIENKYHLNNRHLPTALPRLTSVSVPKQSQTLIKLTARAYAPKEAATTLRRIAAEIIRRQNTLIRNFTDIQNADLAMKRKEAEEIGRQLHAVQTSLERMERQMASTQTDMLPLFAAQYTQIIEKYADLKTMYNKLQNEIKSIRIALSPLYVKHARIVDKVTTYSAPVKPRKSLVILGALIFGLLLGIAVALGREFFTSRDTESSDT